jgi:hypothetical protein
VPPFPIPPDVREWIRDAFAGCNQRVAAKMSRIPTVHETSLDLSFVEEISQLAVPVRLPSSWTIRLDTHYLGGMRHWGSWEIADIGFLVLMRRGGKVIRSKIALLQSKRLYPIEQDYEEDTPIDYYRGFGRLWQSDESFLQVTQPREFHFQETSRYKALVVGDDQYRFIGEYEKKHRIPVHYLLYHPLRLPTSQRLPLQNARSRRRGACVVGCRVVPSSSLRKALAKRDKGYSPSYADLKFMLPDPFDDPSNEVGWRLEGFVADLLIQCKAGYIPTGPNDAGVNLVFAERGAPISAAISLTIEAPG